MSDPVAEPRRRPSPLANPAYLILLVPPLCWAGNFVIGRAMHAEIPPLAFSFWRWAVALALLLPFAGRDSYRCWAVIRRSWRLITLLSVTGVVLFQVFVYRGLQSTTAINGVLIMAIIPAAIPVVAYAVDRSRITGRQLLGIALSLLGVAVVILDADPRRLAALTFGEGDLWVAAAVPMWAVYSVAVKRRPAELPPHALLLATMLIGIAILFPAYLWERAVTGPFAVTPATLAAIVYVGAFASLLAFVCWNRGVAAVGAAKAGPFLHLMPVFGTLLAIAFLGEALLASDLIGIAIIAAGLILSSTAPPLRRR
ncbi:MAG: DMT family transporter [Rhodospirillales bacterium]|jgi:drug/metabolite transporter (DMT)-like permease|nr:DMT family transporter [Rhodospirillales bacterium]